MAKPKVALYWCSSCGGCEESVVDLAQDLLFVTGAVDIVFWPVAMDFKRSDVEAMADGSIALALINGAVRTSEQEHMVKLLRQKSQLVIAHGSCAHMGGVVGLANLYPQADVLARAFQQAPTMCNPEQIMPQTNCTIDGKELTLPSFHHTVKSLAQVIAVDYILPGCPPTPELLKNAVMAVLEGKLPAKGTVLAERTALCQTCARRQTKPEQIHLREFKRIYEIICDSEQCFLNQGVICLGYSTRGGCNARCISANMPCRGCFGPVDNVADHGAKNLTALASLIDENNEDALARIAETIPDSAGLFYRYSLAHSPLRQARNRGENGKAHND